MLNGVADRIGYNETKIIETNDYIYFTYLDSELYNYIVQCDKDLNIIATKKLNKAIDNHGGCSIAIDKHNYVHVLGGGHANKSTVYYRSTSPNNINNFTQSLFGCNSTYNYMFAIDDKICVVFRDSVIAKSNMNILCYIEKDITETSFIDNKVDITELNDIYYPSYSINVNTIDTKIIATFNWYNSKNDISEKRITITKNYDDLLFKRLDETFINSKLSKNDYDTLISDSRNTNSFIYQNNICFIESMLNGKNNKLVSLNRNEQLLNIGTVFVNSVSQIKDDYYLFTVEKTTNQTIIFITKDFINFDSKLIGSNGDTLIWNCINSNIQYKDSVYYMSLIDNNILEITKIKE